MGGVNRYGGNARLEHGRYLDHGGGQFLVVFYTVMVGMYGDGHGDCQFIAQGVDDAGYIPVVDGTVCLLPPLRLGDLDDDWTVGPLRRSQDPADDEVIPAVGCHCYRLAFGKHGPVDHFAADDKRFRVGKKLFNVGRTSHLKRFFEISRIPHTTLPLLLLKFFYQNKN